MGKKLVLGEGKKMCNWDGNFKTKSWYRNPVLVVNFSGENYL